MHSHLAIIGKNGELTLKPDDSLTVTDKNPMFNDVEMFSQPLALSFDKNRHILKNMDDVNSTMKAAEVDNERFRFIVDGIPFRTAALKIQDGSKLDDTIDVNFEATTKTFKDMIQDMRCRDVEVDPDILIGEKVGDVAVDFKYTEKYIAEISCWAGPNVDGYEIIMKQDVMHEVFQPFALGFSYPAECNEKDATTHEAEQASKGGKLQAKVYPNTNKDARGNITVKVPSVKTSYINTSQPYPAAKYCNSRIAYAHHKASIDDQGKYTGETDDEIVPADERERSIPEDKSPYWVLDADRPASGICFYVAYFLECLFKTLGVAYDMSALTNIEDFNYLAFFTTGCHYDTREKTGVTLDGEETINKWLESRGCGGKINLSDNKPKEDENLNKIHVNELKIAAGTWKEWNVIGNHGAYNQYVSTDITNSDGSITINWSSRPEWSKVPGQPVTPRVEYYVGCRRQYTIDQATMSAKVLQMYANSDNFPDVNVSEVIESLENSFGVRFCYDAETNKVSVKLLRDMFRSQQAPIPFKGVVTKMVKMTENIRGIRMKYSAESDPQDQRDNIRYGKRDYDTVYDYMDYPQEYTKFATFDEVTQSTDVGNRNGYCDLNTGNFYRIKVNSDASTVAELRPAVFEVGGLHGVELGDCSKEAEDSDGIREFVSSFEPIQVNDVAYRGKNYANQEDPLLVPFVDEDMEHEFLIKKLLNPVSTKWGNIDIVYELCLAESYDPTTTDDGQSPLMSHDWGLTVGFLRPGSGTENIVDYDRGYDGFDNSKWLISAKDYSINADTYDEHGNFIGTNPATSFSLKPRAYKPFRYRYVGNELQISTDPKQWEDAAAGWLIPCNDDVRNAQGIITQRLRSRGMCDTWMIDFLYFLLHRQKYHVEALCTAAELADLPNKWLRRWEIDGKVGWIGLSTYPLSVENGVGKVELEFYAL